MNNLKTISVNSLKIQGHDREFSIHGGLLYVSGTPVQSYFSKNMFYWESQQERGAIYLYHHGLMAKVCIERDGVRETYNAATEQHYKITYRPGDAAEDSTLDVYFGVSFDSGKNSHFYCGLKYNAREIIPIPQTDEEKANQCIMAVDVNKEGLLHIVIDSSAYKDVVQDFPVSKVDMVFDATYNSCTATITQGEANIKKCPATLDLWEMEQTEPTLKGNLRIQYTSVFDPGERTITMCVDSLKNKDKDHYYGSIQYESAQIVAMPTTDEERLAQDVFSCGLLVGKWKVSAKKLSPQSQSNCYVQSLTVWDDPACSSYVYEAVSQTVSYQATGYIQLSETLKNRNRKFRADKQASARLKENCVSGGFSEPPLSADDLFTLAAPPQLQIEDPDNPGSYIVVDGQQYVHQKSTEILSYLAAYYTADITSSDKQISYADLYGYTKEYAESQIRQVSPSIIPEIEAEVDENKKKYVVEFLEKFSDIILSSSYAGSSNEYIQKGYRSVTKPVERCQYYMSDDHTGAMQNEKGYCIAMSIIDRYVYMSLVPRLKAYCADKSTNWAEELYYTALDRLVMLQLQTIGGSNRATHLTKMLTILDAQSHVLRESKQGKPIVDDDGKEVQMPYGPALYAQLFNMALAQMGNSFQGPDDEENYLKIMEVVFGDLYDKISQGDVEDIPDAVLQELQEMLQKDRDTYIVEQLCMLEEFLSVARVAQDLVSTITKYSLDKAVQAKISWCAIYIFIGLSFNTLFSDWDTLSDAEKAEGILSGIFCMVGTAREAMTWYSVSKLMNPDTPVEERTQAAYRLKYGGTEFEAIKEALPPDPNNSYDLAQRLDKTSKQYSLEIKDQNGVNAKLSFCSKVFVCVEIAFQVLNVLLMGFSFVLSSISLDTLFKYDYSTALRVVSTINTVLLGAAFILGVADLGIRFSSIAAASSIASMIPGLSFGVFLFSLGFTIAEMILKKQETKPPIQLIIEEHLVKTVAALTEPPEKWGTMQLLPSF